MYSYQGIITCKWITDIEGRKVCLYMLQGTDLDGPFQYPLCVGIEKCKGIENTPFEAKEIP